MMLCVRKRKCMLSVAAWAAVAWLGINVLVCSTQLSRQEFLMGSAKVLASTPTIAEQEAIEFHRLSQTLELPPVNARVDRVWHGIPGLSGWVLDEAASHRITLSKHDGKLYLVWTEQQPDIKLQSLPMQPVFRGPAEEKTVSLMFNVSWGEEYVPTILKTLKQNHVFATFFLDAAWVQRHAALTKQIVAAGHVIGSHGNNHPDFAKLSDSRLRMQMATSNQIIMNATGVRPRLLAPPAGSFDSRTVRFAKAEGMYTILWTVDTVDWRRPPASTIVQRAVSRAESGAFILMHPTSPTAEALPAVIQGLRLKGFRFKTIQDVIEEHRMIRPPAVLSARYASGMMSSS